MPLTTLTIYEIGGVDMDLVKEGLRALVQRLVIAILGPMAE